MDVPDHMMSHITADTLQTLSDDGGTKMSHMKGLRHVRSAVIDNDGLRLFRRGYRNVINEAIRLNSEGTESLLAIETSGHGAFKENFFLDDGAYIVTKLIIELSRARKEGYTLASLIDTLREPAESAEFRMNLSLEDFKPYGQRIIDDLTALAPTRAGWSLAPSNYEGVRVNLDKEHGDGWFLLRLSLHEPLMPLNIESDSVGGVKKIAAELAGFLKGYEYLDSRKVGE